MLTKSIFFIQLIVILLIDKSSAVCTIDCKNGTCTEQNECICSTGFTGSLCEIQSNGLCSDNGTTDAKSLLNIAFDSGPDEYSNSTPFTFNFSTTYQQHFGSPTKPKLFGFVNLVSNSVHAWHAGALDHTANDTGGYMFLVDVAEEDSLIFKSTIVNLCIGLRYEFSAYLANVVRKQCKAPKPNLRFEVRAVTAQNDLLAQLLTRDIPDYDSMTWSKHGLSFIAPNSSINLLMISNVGGVAGNDIAIDDIELRVCSTVQSSFSPSDLTSVATTVITTLETTTEEQTPSPTPYFIRKSCNDSSYLGGNCNAPNSPCEMMKPCENNGNCINNKTERHGYVCSCLADFNGTHCELDYRACKPNTCLNHGICNETLNRTFPCTCHDGWQGIHCESMTNYCNRDRCLNNGVCRPIVGNYTCECLGDSYSGLHCEITSTKTFIYKIVSKSFAYIAIVAMSIVVMFVVIMDILKYCFGIDPTRDELERLRREKQARKPKRPVIQRFIYVNAPLQPPKDSISTIEGTTV